MTKGVPATTGGHNRVPLSSDGAVYVDASGELLVDVRLDMEGETVWLTQAQLADLFSVDVRTVNEHLVNIYRAGELEREATIRKFRMVRQEGQRQGSGRLGPYLGCSRMIRLTLDTNIIRDLLEPTREGHAFACTLVELDETGRCELRLVSRINADIPDGPLRSRIASLSIWRRPTIPTIGQWGLSRWDEDFWASEDDAKLVDNLLNVIFPGAKSNESKQRSRMIDIGHLVGHLRAGRDKFVTNEKAFLAQAAKLEAEFRIRVCSSNDAVGHMRNQSECEDAGTARQEAS